jgi:hypothetical protein
MRNLWLIIAFLFFLAGQCLAETSPESSFQKKIQPLLSQYCYDCHGDGMHKGDIAFDELKTKEAILNHELWLKVIKNVRAGLMPPEKKARPSAAEQQQLEDWIKYEAFGIDPKNPDPGRVTVRRLNRVEYRNTVRDLMGTEFDTENEFPPDDTGYGFDNIGDVLTISPMLLEKYLEAAKSIVSKSVPQSAGVVAEKLIPGRSFRGDDTNTARENGKGGLSLPYYDHTLVTNIFTAEHAGRYQLVLDLVAAERYVEARFDYNKCLFTFKSDGEELVNQKLVREGNRALHYEFDRDWQPGPHQLVFEVQPLTPDEKQIRSLALRIDSVTVRGPMADKYFVRPKNYDRFFTKQAPTNSAERRTYAKQLLGGFARKAFRRPVDERTVSRLAGLAEEVYSRPGNTFEAGISHAMIAVLASPRFLFREESLAGTGRGTGFPLIDEYALASRLSYFLWSSMPDDELFRLAEQGELRKQLQPQVKRMLADSRAKALALNFTGQWLQGRDIETVVIEARAVLARDEKPDRDMERLRARFRELRNKVDEDLTPAEREELAKMRAEFAKRFTQPRVELTGELRQAMRREMDMFFDYVVREDRSVVDFIDSDYTFLNERLARHYGLTNLNIIGDEFRRVTLPSDSPRGGVLTMGSVLAVTSNPTRTSPVKRGLFVLDNILGTPPPPPPPNIPPLEDAAKGIKDHEPTLRETLEMHRAKPLCSSCHNRLDPLGLAMENFNAMGMWREKERNQPVDVTGKLLTGEAFDNVRELKHILAANHRRDFYRCITEKLMTYALGRGLDYYDVEAVDQIVARLEKQDGRFSALLMGVIESPPFQKCRSTDILSSEKAPQPPKSRAEAMKRS